MPARPSPGVVSRGLERLAPCGLPSPRPGSGSAPAAHVALVRRAAAVHDGQARAARLPHGQSWLRLATNMCPGAPRHTGSLGTTRRAARVVSDTSPSQSNQSNHTTFAAESRLSRSLQLVTPLPLQARPARPESEILPTQDMPGRDGAATPSLAADTPSTATPLRGRLGSTCGGVSL